MDARALQILFVVGTGAFALWSFAQTRDPMILVFGAIAVAATLVVMRVMARDAAAPRGGKRCGCGELNEETSRYCSACGKAL